MIEAVTLLPDHHTHHWRCGHATGHLRDVVEAARTRTLSAVGFSDHGPLLFLPGDHPLPQTAMPHSAYPEYTREMLDLKAEYADRIPVLAGVEADFVPGSEADYRALIASAPLDYVIGSVHWLDGWSIFKPKRPDGWTRGDAWSRYLALTREAVTDPFFDVLAHMDCLKTKGHMPTKWHTPELDETLDAIRDSGVAIELNTSGWRKPVNECFPSPAILALTAQRGIPVCLGSDAHRPQDVGADFERAAKLLYEAGYRETVSFNGRERRVLPLA